MKRATYIIIVIYTVFFGRAAAQTTTFKERNKWGIKENEKVIIPAIYDSIFNFDDDGKVCLACFKSKGPTNKIIKTNTFTYHCNYLNKQMKKLTIKTEQNDTCTVFSLGKNSYRQYTDQQRVFSVAVKGKKYLVSKEFNQLTFKGYHDISPSVEPMFYQAQVMDETETVLSGLLDLNEKTVIPFQYAHIRINPVDSIIMGCTAGIKTNGEDDLFDYTGKKKESYHRHVEMATRHFIIHRVFEPKDHFVIYNIATKEEKNLQANEVHFFEHDEILIRIKDDWYVYDLNTHTKKPKQY